jgi:hypothetical protein
MAGDENEAVYGPKEGSVVPTDVRVWVPDVAEHRQAGKLRRGGCAETRHEVGAMHQGDPLPTQLSRQPDGSPEKWTGPTVARVDGAECGGLKSRGAKE